MKIGKEGLYQLLGVDCQLSQFLPANEIKIKIKNYFVSFELKKKREKLSKDFFDLIKYSFSY